MGMQKVMLIDNCLTAVDTSPKNCCLIKDYYGDPSDQELQKAWLFISDICDLPDIREHLVMMMNMVKPTKDRKEIKHHNDIQEYDETYDQNFNKNYDDKNYDDNNYDDKNYDKNFNKNYDDNNYDDKNCDDKNYDDKNYDDKNYDDKNYEDEIKIQNNNQNMYGQNMYGQNMYGQNMYGQNM